MTRDTSASTDAAPARPMAQAKSSASVPILWLFGALALVPVAATLGAEGYILSLVTRALILAIAALSLDLILGYGALVSFGHAAFIGIGSYAVGILAAHGITELAVQLLVALVAAGVFAALTSAVSLRTSGVYYIMSTLAFGQMLYFFCVSLSAYGGDDGMTLQARSKLLGSDVLRSDRVFYYLCLGLLFLCYIVTQRIVASRFGRVLGGIRENAIRMQAIGFEPFRYQLTACVFAGVMCAVAGVLLANQAEFVSPAYMTWQRSGELMVMVILGGIGTLWGAILGALAFLLLEEVLSRMTEHWKLILGPLLVLVALSSRGGMAGAISRLNLAWRGRRS
jgi:branched-chain amino acid transport system permease protein